MLLSDISITRPVFATVLSLLLVAFGSVAFERLPLREYPDIDPPVVSIDTVYPGASATVVETQITEPIEERIAGLEGIRFIQSSSEDGRSRISVQFAIDRDIDAAANDIRDRVSGLLDDLPLEADTPEIQKVDSNDDVIVWLNLSSDRMTVPELTDYADRYLVDRFSTLDGVARIRIGGGESYAMRIWLDRNQLAANQLTVNDVEAALRAENVELPAGSIESSSRQFTVRVERYFNNADDFAKLVLARGDNGYLVRLGDVARVAKSTIENRTFFRGNGEPMVGIGIIKQSTANTIDVARAAQQRAAQLNANLPDGMRIEESYDTSVFIEGAIKEVYKTLLIAIGLVVFIIYLFLGNARVMLIPAVTVPVSLIATFTVLYALGFTVNLFTLLALVLAIGLVVDDAIVVLENIQRRIEEHNESALVAAFRGTRQVGFAVIATTLVLVAVFVPIAFLQGDVGRLFSEFALTMVAAVSFSSFVALTLSPALAAKILRKTAHKPKLALVVDQAFHTLKNLYSRGLHWCLTRPLKVILAYLLFIAACLSLLNILPSEYVPPEDRGAFFIIVNGPEGASYAYTKDYMDEIERRLMPLAESGEANRVLVRAPRSFGNFANFNNGIVIVVLNDWQQRRSGWEIVNEVRQQLASLPGVMAFPIMPQGIGGGFNKPVQFVIGGGSYQELAEWRDILLAKIADNNPGLQGIDWDYKETKPHIGVSIDYDRAAELGVTISSIGRTLQSMLGSRRVTTYIDNGQEYDVLIEGERSQQRTPMNLTNIYVRSERSNQLIPLANLVQLHEFADSSTLNRYNRVRALTLEANLAENYSLGDALNYLAQLVRTELPEHAIIDYKGASQDFKYSSSSVLFTFALGLMVVFLVLAAQFESYLHPFIIMLTVPLAIAGGLLGLWLTGNSLNLFSQIGLVMLVGLAAKNGILIVEFANQLRDRGLAVAPAVVDAALVRLRPIVMTSITTTAGAIPLILSAGPGTETRMVIGITVLFGIAVSTLLTLFVVPVAYRYLAQYTQAKSAIEQRLEAEMAQTDQ